MAKCEGHHSGGRQRDPALSADDGGFEAASADLRQADDLLSAERADAGGDPRHPDHLDAARPAGVPAPAGRRLGVRHLAQLCRAAAAQRPCRGLHHRTGFHRRRRRRDDPRRQYFSATGCRRSAATRRRARRAPRSSPIMSTIRERYGVVSFDSESGRRRHDRGKARDAEIELGGHRALFLRQRRRRHRRVDQAVARAASSRSPRSTASISNAATFTCTGWAAAMPGSTPAPMTACTTPPPSCAPSRTGRASRSPVRRRSRSNSAGLTPEQVLERAKILGKNEYAAYLLRRVAELQQT